MKKLLFILAGILFSVQGYCDDSVKWPHSDVWPESPTARAFRQATFPTPAMLTGAVEFDVPLYDLAVENVVLPFSLRYRSNGIRVESDPYPVGPGWSFFPMLKVTRQIMGRPDEMFPFVGDEPIESFDYRKCYRTVTDSVYSTFWQGVYTDSLELESLRRGLHSPRYDGEHDIFTISLLDATLTVLLDNRRFVGIGCTDYKIELDCDWTKTKEKRRISINVTDPNGLIYKFNVEGEHTRFDTVCNEWLLGEIELPSGSKITFNWSNPEKNGYYRHKNRNIMAYQTKVFKYTPPGYLPQSCGVEGGDGSYSPITTAHYTGYKDLDSIEFPGGKVTFSYLTSKDYSCLMDGMKVVWGNDTVWRAEFKQNNLKECLLTDINISDVGKYHFEYNPKHIDYYSTPHKVEEVYDFANSQDVWGFCRIGYGYPQHPTIDLIKLPSGNKVKETISGDFRASDDEYMQASMLIKAVYPTGGSAEWEYEPHRFKTIVEDNGLNKKNSLDKGGGIRVKKVTLKSSDDDPNPIVKNYVYGTDEDGNANVIAAPLLSTFITDTRRVELLNPMETGRIEDYHWYIIGALLLNSGSNYLQYQTNAVPIWYPEVTEYSEKGCVKTFFKNFCDTNVVRRQFGIVVPELINTIFSKGPQMVKREIYKADNNGFKKVRTESWDYVLLQNGKGLGNTVIRRQIQQFRSRCERLNPDFGEIYLRDGFVLGTDGDKWPQLPGEFTPEFFGIFGIPPELICIPMRYGINRCREWLQSYTVTEHHDNGDISETEQYYYNDDSETLILKSKSTPDNQEIITEYYYPSDRKSNVDREMVAANVIKTPIRIVTTKGTSSQTVEYHMKRVGKRVFAAGSIETWRDASAKMWGGNYDYDDRGNLTRRLSADSVTTRWIWDYYGRYPLEQILGDQLVSEAQWKPLVGPVKLKTPNGITSHFDYDSAGRLIRSGISMQGSKGTGNGSVMTEYEYKIGDSDNRLVTKTYIDRYNPLRNIANHDGLGRQVSAVTEFPEGRLADATAYNAMGLPERQWSRVPVSADRPSLSDIATAASTHYRDTVPYALTEYEPSPRGAVTATVRAGASWHSNGKKTTVARHTNVAPAYTCYKWRADADGVTLEGLYPDRTLTVETVTDEEGIAVTTFTDSEGHMLSRRTGAGTTYYVYDDYGDLRYILPPGIYGSRKRTDDVMQQLAYWYDYDSHGHCVLKKLPGAEARQYRYDPAGRLVAETGPDYSPGTWQVYLFDGLGRPALTATGSFASANVTKFASIVRKVALTGSSKAVGRTGYEVITPKTVLPHGATYTATYYDDYSFISSLNLGNYFEKDTVTSLTGGLSAVIPGMSNPNRVFAADGLVTGIYTGDGYEAIYYDGYGRECQRVGTGYNAGRHYMTYDIYGSLLRERFVSGYGSDAPQRDVSYSYDRAGRLLSTQVTMEGHTAEIIPAYDRIGNVSSMRYGTAISRRLAYDLHGWLKRSDCGSNTTSSRIYGETLAYKYNGYLSSKTITSTGKYTYSYDTSGRLVKAAWSGIGGSDYSSTYSYDPRGNITAMKRWGMTDRLPDGTGEFGLLDDITATYSGNRLTGLAVESGAVAFEGISGYGREVDATLEYDRAGRLTRDPSRGITLVTYNRHGLPEWTYFDDGHATLDTYDGLGRHMATKRYTMETQVFGEHETQVPVYQSTRSYTGDGVICEDGKWRIARFAGGYFTPDPLVVKPVNPGLLKTSANVRVIPDTLSTAVMANLGGAHYYITDHQGNNVAVADSTGRVEQRTDYYPYGTPWTNSATHPFLYSGKEWLSAHGLNEYDFDARRYAPLIPRFTTLDPLCEKRPWESPYLYCGANPVNAIDPDGKKWTLSSYRDDKDILHVDIELTGVVYNTSQENVDLEKLASNIQQQIDDVFTYSDENIVVTMESSIKVGENDEKTDGRSLYKPHIFTVVDQDKLGSMVKLGDAQMYGLKIRISPKLANQTIEGTNNRSIAHEVGHTGGLAHLSDNNKKSAGFNLMTQTKNLPPKTDINAAIKIERFQMVQILDNYKKGKLHIR